MGGFSMAMLNNQMVLYIYTRFYEILRDFQTFHQLYKTLVVSLPTAVPKSGHGSSHISPSGPSMFYYPWKICDSRKKRF
jgi:hypothetical protein